MVHLVLLNRPSKPICVANMLVALMYFAVGREQKIWIYAYEIGFFFIFIFLFYLLLFFLFFLFYNFLFIYFVQWVSTLRQWRLTRGEHLGHG